METDLYIRLQAYAATEALIPADPFLCADALASSAAALSGASAGIICSHTRILRGDSPAFLRPGQHELDILIADKPAAAKPADQPTGQGTGQSAPEPTNDEASPRPRLALHAGKDTLTALALGAAGIPLIKNQK